PMRAMEARRTTPTSNKTTSEHSSSTVCFTGRPDRKARKTELMDCWKTYIMTPKKIAIPAPWDSPWRQVEKVPKKLQQDSCNISGIIGQRTVQGAHWQVHAKLENPAKSFR